MYKRKTIIALMVSIVFSLFFISYSFATTIPQIINYQGILTDTSGNPVPDGQYGIVFSIYDASTGGTALWTETWNSGTTPITTIGGNFSVLLGIHNSISASFFNDHPTTYLGIKVGSDSEMQPRQKIASVGYAFKAEYGVPKGAIIMWSGAIDQVPNGWALCNGQNGTPDLRDRFIVGASLGGSYAVGATGGETTHTLTVNEMPGHTHVQNAHTHIQNPHSHEVRGSGGTDMANNNTYVRTDNQGGYTPPTTSVTATNQNATPTNQNTGGGAAHENRPPYYALAFIMKL